MTDLNHFVLIGNLTKDVNGDNYSILGNGTARAIISIAVNRSRKSGENWVDEVSYFDITLWGKSAENLKPYLIKGQKVGVEGYLKQDRWEKDGKKMSKINFIADNIWLLGSKKKHNSEDLNQVSQNSIDTLNENEEFTEDIPY